MELKNETNVGFSAEVSIIPVWAWILAVIGFAAMQVVAQLVRQPDAPTTIVRALMGLLVGAVVACYLLLIGSFVQSGFNFCPHCSHKLSPSCPKCQRMVTATDVYCPYCGTTLTAPVTPGAG